MRAVSAEKAVVDRPWKDEDQSTGGASGLYVAGGASGRGGRASAGLDAGAVGVSGSTTGGGGGGAAARAAGAALAVYVEADAGLVARTYVRGAALAGVGAAGLTGARMVVVEAERVVDAGADNDVSRRAVGRRDRTTFEDIVW